MMRAVDLGAARRRVSYGGETEGALVENTNCKLEELSRNKEQSVERGEVVLKVGEDDFETFWW
jgi:hypothetical protein